MKTTTVLLGAAAFLVVAGIGFAQEMDRWQVMLRLDKDGDGKISAAEYGGGEERFARFDKNKDGFITADEVTSAGPGEAGRGRRGGPRQRPNPTVDLVRAADADANKETSRDEWTKLVASLKGEDGAVDGAKLMAKLAPKDGPMGPPRDGTREGERPAPPPEGRGGLDGPRGPRGRGGFGRGGPPSPEMMTRVFDRNRDGKLDGADFDSIFTDFDKDKDGKIVEAELAAAQTAQRRARSAGLLARIADADQSGDVTKGEWETFRIAVTDESGAIDLDALAEMMPMRRGGRGGPGGGGGADRMKGMLTRTLDADEDETVTAAELDAAYKALDKNGDGAIDAEEMPQRGRMGGRGGR